MTWASVRPRLSTIVGATTPTTKARGLGDKFAPVTTASDAKLPASRGFWWTVDAMVVSSMTPRNRRYRETTTAALNIAYSRDVDPQTLDDAIHADYTALTARLVDSSLWDMPTSTIVIVEGVDEAVGNIFPATIDDVDGKRVLRITVNVMHEVSP